jgi:hypothetical protein
MLSADKICVRTLNMPVDITIKYNIPITKKGSYTENGKEARY